MSRFSPASTNSNTLIATVSAIQKTRFAKSQITVNMSTDTLTIPSHGLVNGDIVHAMVNSKPAGTPVFGTLKYGTDMYVINVNGDSFQLSASTGGAALDITGVNNTEWSLYKKSADETLSISGLNEQKVRVLLKGGVASAYETKLGLNNVTSWEELYATSSWYVFNSTYTLKHQKVLVDITIEVKDNKLFINGTYGQLKIQDTSNAVMAAGAISFITSKNASLWSNINKISISADSYFSNDTVMEVYKA